jgi:hypothetical protein
VSEETFIARQRLDKHVPAETNTQAIINILLETVFSVWSMQSGYIRRELRFGTGSYPCGGGVEYLHRDPASRRRRRKGKSQI